MKKNNQQIFHFIVFFFSIFLFHPSKAYSREILNNGLWGINIDINGSYYTKSRNINGYEARSCAWFVTARVAELTGKDIVTVYSPTDMPSNFNSFYGFSTSSSFPSSGKAVAVYSGHVRIIESVSGDSVLISEGGYDGQGMNTYGYCRMAVLSKTDVLNGLVCFIIIPESAIILPSNQKPVGEVEGLYGSESSNYGAANGMIHMKGFAFDSDDTSQDIKLRVYVGGDDSTGTDPYQVQCNHVYHPGVVNRFGNVGDHHGFALAIPVNERGTKEVYVYAIDVGNTFVENPLIGHGTVTITDDGHTPRGEIYSVENKDNGTIRIRGWAYDPDTPGEGITLLVYVGGKAGTVANHYEVQTSSPANEYNYEFDFLIPVQERGEKDVYVYALDKGNSFTTNPVIGYGWVNITKTAKSPIGYIEKIEGSENGTIHIQGWTWDPDDITQDLMLYVYVGGDSGTGAGPYQVQSNHIRCDLAIPKSMCDAVVAKHGDVGYFHGFDLVLPVHETGVQDVHVYAVDTGTPSKDNTLLSHENVTISDNGHSLRGQITSLKGSDNGTIQINGWAYDPDTPGEGIELHIYVGGYAGSAGTRNYIIHTPVLSADNNYSFDLSVPVEERGEFEVYIYARDKVDEVYTYPQIGKYNVTISDDGHSLRGQITSLKGSDNGTIQINGWAYDPDTPGEGIELHMYVGGYAGSAGARNYIIHTPVLSADNNYSFDLSVSVEERGEFEVYIYARNKDDEVYTYPQIGKCNVTITKPIENKLILPSNLKEIGSSVFEGSTSIDSVYIPNGVTTISARAFANCTGLTIIRIPDSVTSIGTNAFLNDSNVTLICQSSNKTCATYAQQNQLRWTWE